MTDTIFSIARQFSPYPGPRYDRQGKHSGQALRRQLIKLLNAGHQRILVDLDGTKGIGSSFLDEAFGGLVRWEKKSPDDLLKRFTFRSAVDPSYIDEIIDSIKRAVPADPAAVH